MTTFDSFQGLGLSRKVGLLLAAMLIATSVAVGWIVVDIRAAGAATSGPYAAPPAHLIRVTTTARCTTR